jgi:hypothetical protein
MDQCLAEWKHARKRKYDWGPATTKCGQISKSSLWVKVTNNVAQNNIFSTYLVIAFKPVNETDKMGANATDIVQR